MLEDTYRISSPETIVEIGNGGDVEMDEYAQISLVADGIRILNPHADIRQKNVL